ncbi:hypothetical protein QBC38DRAFT_360249 [Podospora fimiseda]|uniref:DnaJ-like protein C11 C-terminal domain-containing protein n=1 Tax=Podospora fimiseda TaxID=252190 RepID=A0AAN7H1G1_9PEZI|nr:hypothetical protein QBC38DRAFT_360249 [Podospora fimiseda]
MSAPSRRVPSGNAPTAGPSSSVAFDDNNSQVRLRLGVPHGGSSRLRPTGSRFSLNDQFATTRKEYEFGFDDASTVASGPGSVRGIDLEDMTVGYPSAAPAKESHKPATAASLQRNYYELLCLDKGPNLTPEQVEAASRRLTQVLAVDSSSPRQQRQASFYQGLVQAATETLTHPAKRLGYDLAAGEEADIDSDELTVSDFVEDSSEDEDEEDTYKTNLEEQYEHLTREEAKNSTGLSLRYNASSFFDSSHSEHGPNLHPIDFALQKSHTTRIHSLKPHVENAVISLVEFFSPPEGSSSSSHNIRVSTPQISLKGTAHGLLDEPAKLAPIVVDRYQPPGPTIYSRKYLGQLLSTRFLPVISLAARQEISWRDSTSPKPPKDLILEQELELLPHLATTSRVAHSIHLSDSHDPLHVELAAKTPLGHHGKGKLPSLGIALHKQIGENTAFAIADSGNWRGIIPGQSEKCSDLTKYIKGGSSSGIIPMIEAFRAPPTLEVGYSFGRHEEEGMGMQVGEALCKMHEKGMTSLDSELSKKKKKKKRGAEEDSWTISAGLTPGNAATYLRYSWDLFSWFFEKKKGSSFRTEIELGGTAQKDFFIAFRALRLLGRYSKVGLEVGLSPTNLFLSCYWSRLGQRISLPFLIANGSRLRGISSKIIFWSTVFPFAAFAAWEMYVDKRKKDKMRENQRRLQRARELVNEFVARKRAEADEVTGVLGVGVEVKQVQERRRGGLVILSAKYGVRDAPPEEKGRLLGFWDPAPISRKVLRVRYLWEGREMVVEVDGREELRLP